MIPFPQFPHLPDMGDPTPGRTHEAVGEFIHCWESVEFELSRTFSAVMGKPDGRLIMFYGEHGRIFKDRLNLLKIAIGHEFVVRPHQGREAQFDKLVEAVTWYSERRNEIAHSVVYDLTDLPSFTERHEGKQGQGSNYFAVPPLYAFTKREAYRLAGKSPPYALSSVELHALCAGCLELLRECRDFRHSLFPSEWAEERAEA